MTVWPAWLRLGLVLPLLGVNAFVIKRVMVQFAPQAAHEALRGMPKTFTSKLSLLPALTSARRGESV